MNRFKMYLFPMVVVLSLMVIAGCSLFSSGDPVPSNPPDEPGEPSDFIFYYDFSEHELGDLQSVGELTVTNPNGERGDVKIVADSAADSGKALYLKTVTWAESPRPSMSVRFPKWDVPSEDVEVIAYEYKLKYVSGSAGMYLYATQGGSIHRIILRPISQEELVWTATLDGKTSTTVNVLQPGWNTIRVVADRTTNLGDLYVNDMETPVATSLKFQRDVETWEEMLFIITHETHATEVREAYYADLKVWIVD